MERRSSRVSGLRADASLAVHHRPTTAGELSRPARKAVAETRRLEPLKKRRWTSRTPPGVLYDERASTVRNDESGEERYAALGMDALGRVLVVVYRWRGVRATLQMR